MNRNPSPTISETLRAAVRDGATTRYRISLATGISQTILSRFVRGVTGLSLENTDTLAAYFGLRLLSDPEARRPEPTPANRARPMLARPTGEPPRKPRGANKAKGVARKRTTRGKGG